MEISYNCFVGFRGSVQSIGHATVIGEENTIGHMQGIATSRGPWTGRANGHAQAHSASGPWTKAVQGEPPSTFVTRGSNFHDGFRGADPLRDLGFAAGQDLRRTTRGPAAKEIAAAATPLHPPRSALKKATVKRLLAKPASRRMPSGMLGLGIKTVPMPRYYPTPGECLLFIFKIECHGPVEIKT